MLRDKIFAPRLIVTRVMKPCFHVICKTCVEELVHPSKQCVVCDHEVKPEVDILELKREGPEHRSRVCPIGFRGSHHRLDFS